MRLLQLRDKTGGLGATVRLAERLGAMSRQAGAIFIVNDRVDAAALAEANGVHLGQDDLTPADARALLGPDAIVGRSTHNDAQVRAALDEPISYLAIGPVFATLTKTRPDPVVGLDGVTSTSALAARAGVPLVAIGGIRRDRAADVLRAGAGSVAVISDLLAGDPAATIRSWLRAVG